MDQRDKNQELELRTINRKSKSKVKIKGVSLEDLSTTSFKLKALVSREEKLFKEELQRLYSLFNTLEDSREIVVPNPSPAGSQQSLVWDDQADLRSPLKDTTTCLTQVSISLLGKKNHYLLRCPGTDQLQLV